MARSVVLGVGNVLLTDEGAGVHAARRIAQLLQSRQDVAVIDGGTLSFTLAPAIEDAARLVILDAAQLGAPPGTVRTFFGREMDRFLGCGKRSVHEVSLIDLLDIVRLTDAIPVRRALVAIQPQRVGWGEDLTAEVARGVGEAVAVTLGLIDAWHPHYHGRSAGAASTP